MPDASSPSPGPIRLSAPPADGGPTIEGQVVLSIAGRPTAFQLQIPAGESALEPLLPVFQGLTNAVVDRGEAQSGAAVSCRAGCGACCRQAVPIAEAEARALAALVDAMPPARQAELRERFAAAEQRLAESGLSERLAGLAGAETAAVNAAGLDYFRLGVACPFLEAEACSIHPDRPLACREYLVTSPAAACAEPDPAQVRPVPLPARPSRTLFELAKAETEGGWLLLVQALSFAARHPASADLRPARAWVEAGFNALAAG